MHKEMSTIVEIKAWGKGLGQGPSCTINKPPPLMVGGKGRSKKLFGFTKNLPLPRPPPTHCQ